MAWIRLDSNYMDDPKVWDAGWEAGLLWPAVLSLLKENDGVLSDDVLSPRYLARKMACPVELAEKAIDGIKSSGLLVSGVVSWKVHKGNVISRDGWHSEQWVKHGNAPDSWAVGNVPEPSRRYPKVSEPSPTLPNVPPSSSNDSRARSGSVGEVGGSVGSVGSNSEGETGEAQTDLIPKPKKNTKTDPRFVRIWDGVKGHVSDSNKDYPPADLVKLLVALFKADPDLSVDTLAAMPQWIMESPQKYPQDRRADGYCKTGTLYKQESISDRMGWCEDWLQQGAVKAVPSKAVAPTEADGSARLSYQSWSWFEGELSARAIELGFTPEQVSAAWAKKHKEASNVPSWVFDRAVENVRKERT